jgi:hypothetical protein
MKINKRGFWENQTTVGHHDDKILLNEIINILVKNEAKSIVDFGCGNGFYIKNIKEFADFAQKNPHYKLKVVGHTSSDGLLERNMKCSLDRAQEVKKKLMMFGVAEERMIADGKGPLEMIADDSTPEGKHLNRRVVVELSKEESIK